MDYKNEIEQDKKWSEQKAPIDIGSCTIKKKNIKLGSTPATEYSWYKDGNHVGSLTTFKWWDGVNIENLKINDEYKKQGYSYKLLDYATKELKATNLSVKKDNSIAKHVYDKQGFKTVDEDNEYYYMSTDPKQINEKSSGQVHYELQIEKTAARVWKANLGNLSEDSIKNFKNQEFLIRLKNQKARR